VKQSDASLDIAAPDFMQSSQRLQRDFDRSFAEAPPTGAHLDEDFLAIRIGSNGYAIRLSDVVGLHRVRKIVPIPTRATHLLGISSFRGMTAPIYDLRALLGHASAAPPGWLVLARGPSPVGFAFDVLEKHLRIATTSVEVDPQARLHIHGIVRTTTSAFSLIQIASVLEALTHGPHGRMKE
jgi:chemotaxis signal transduction protein